MIGIVEGVRLHLSKYNFPFVEDECSDFDTEFLGCFKDTLDGLGWSTVIGVEEGAGDLHIISRPRGVCPEKYLSELETFARLIGIMNWPVPMTIEVVEGELIVRSTVTFPQGALWDDALFDHVLEEHLDAMDTISPAFQAISGGVEGHNAFFACRGHQHVKEIRRGLSEMLGRLIGKADSCHN